MKFDYYCVALVVLVLFFLYLDNNSNLEGFASLDENKDKKPSVEFSNKVEVKGSSIGQVPQKLASKPPPSMQKDLSVLSTSSDLTSLDNAFAPLLGSVPTSNQFPSNLLSTGSRVGGKGNLGDSTIGTVGGPVKSMGSDKVQGIPVLENPMLGAPLDYALDTKVLLSGVKPVSPPGMAGQPGMAGKPGMAKSKGPKKKLELHMVYTNWCGHSKRAMPDFDKVANEIDGSTMGNHNVSVVKHDADTEEGKAFAKEHGVGGFPTHFLIVEGKKIESGVGRTYDEIMGKIKSITGV
uniref:Thioredoxin domain-containing protein n=1 Tax=viral metagenome TaxID=1070528 RepID=A0A6C0CEJ0_9ZZZZ